MPASILLTQCLQNDFVMPIEKYDPLPNQLHIGYSEARRLMGESPAFSPVHSVIRWAYAQNPETLTLIHIRDWHDEKSDTDHLNQFGSHCLKNSLGARFVFESEIPENPQHHLVQASGLNDFQDTSLQKILNPFSGNRVKIGIMGVWTEAKIFFLAYELKTRYPEFDVAVCSALTASSSRAAHFASLDQMKKILGVQIFSSVGDFTQFLAGSLPDLKENFKNPSDSSRLVYENPFPVSPEDEKILSYLFRDCRKAELKSLDGGFSGNLVLKAKSIDLQGHRQVPTVVKIGERNLIARERMAFEQVQEVLGNNAPHIVESAEWGSRGGIKYRYASMLDTRVQTFQDYFEAEDHYRAKTDFFLETIFQEHLGRFYEAAEYEKLNLLDYYDFQPKYAPFVRTQVETVLKRAASGESLEILPGISIFNVCLFYEKNLETLKASAPSSESHYMAFVHGDLNGKNLIIDHQSNVWIIDFFHTHRGHILKDLIKLENDLLYIFTKIDSESEFREALQISDWLADLPDLKAVPGKKYLEKLTFPALKKAFSALRKLRSFYAPLIRTDRDPYQFHVAALRYAMHTLSFEESNLWQKKWALYAGARYAEKIISRFETLQKLRVDWISLPEKISGQLGITLLPGRKDRGRNLKEDLASLKEQGVSHIVSLITPDELRYFGVPDLQSAYREQGFETYFFPILDQGVTQRELLPPLFLWMEQALNSGKKVLLHCVGGLGRSGMIAAAFLKTRLGLDAEEAIARVRKARTERAIETLQQEEFVRQDG